MAFEIGESFVGAYLRIVRDCPVIQYNAIDTVNKGKQGEVDVLGVDYQKKRLYICEVITHLGGALYAKRVDGKVKDETVDRLKKKFLRNRAFAHGAFPDFQEPTYMVWSPYFATGAKTRELQKMVEEWDGSGTLELMVNEKYSAAMNELITEAGKHERQLGETFFRMLQLLTHLRGPGSKRMKLRLE